MGSLGSRGFVPIFSKGSVPRTEVTALIAMEICFWYGRRTAQSRHIPCVTPTGLPSPLSPTHAWGQFPLGSTVMLFDRW